MHGAAAQSSGGGDAASGGPARPRSGSPSVSRVLASRVPSSRPRPSIDASRSVDGVQDRTPPRHHEAPRMALAAGSRLGPYEILAPIGAGGMGEVYKARDTRLDRVVAIKVLPSHLAERPELRLRFEREANAISSLSHPHICTLFDVGLESGVGYLV